MIKHWVILMENSFQSAIMQLICVFRDFSVICKISRYQRRCFSIFYLDFCVSSSKYLYRFLLPYMFFAIAPYKYSIGVRSEYLTCQSSPQIFLIVSQVYVIIEGFFQHCVTSNSSSWYQSPPERISVYL